MPLPQGERSVLARFRSEPQARQAARALQAMGARSVEVSYVRPWPSEQEALPRPPISGRVESLTTLTLGTGGGDADTQAALAAHPAASGLAAGPQADWRPYLLTAVVHEADEGRAVELIRRHGGQL